MVNALGLHKVARIAQVFYFEAFFSILLCPDLEPDRNLSSGKSAESQNRSIRIFLGYNISVNNVLLPY